MSNALAPGYTELVSGGAPPAAALVPLLVPLLVALSAALPAHAQLPRPAEQWPPITVTAPAVVDVDPGVDGSPLTLVASHVDIRVVDTQARVRTTLTWRNGGVAPVQARYRAPLPSTQARLVAEAELDGCADAADALPADIDEAAEAGESPLTRLGTVTLAPGEDVRVTVEREAKLMVRGDHHRLVLPLFAHRQGLFAPRFSATASIDAARPIVDLGSATHAVEIAVLGESQAQVAIAESRVHEGQFLALDFTLGGEPAAAAAATTGAPRWGGEVLARMAAR
jgi:hypothetical protein